MTSSINFSSKIRFLFFSLFAGVFFISGCAPTMQAVHAGSDSVAPRKMRVAVLPVDNLSGRKAPLKEIMQSMVGKLTEWGVDVLGDEEEENFLTRHRIRYMGGIDNATAQALKAEEGVDAVLITSIDLYSETPAAIGIMARLVSTGEKAVILWMDCISLTGNDSPGILGLGLIEDPVELRGKGLRLLFGSLGIYISARGDGTDLKKGKRRYQPKISYMAPFIEANKKYTVAVVPFFNMSDRRNAGEIMLLRFVNELHRQGNVEVVEPGVVRQNLLNVRVIMYEGISLSDVSLVSNMLNSDLILSGRVLDYRDGLLPGVDFSVMVLDRMNKKMIWSSKSYNEGNDGVFFFDRGRLNTAGALASEMTKTVAEKLFVK
jgi:TolB-like protein